MTTKRVFTILAVALVALGIVAGCIAFLVPDAFPLIGRLLPGGQQGNSPNPKRDDDPPTQPDAKELIALQKKRFETAQKNEQEILAAFPKEGRADEIKALVHFFDAGEGKHVTLLTFSPDGKILACLVGELGKDLGKYSIQLWEISKKSQIRTIPVPGKAHGDSNLVYSPEGDKIALDAFGNNGDSIFVWDAKTGKEIRKISFDNSTFFPRAITFLPDNQTLAAAGYGSQIKGIRWWNVVTGEEYRPLSLPNEPNHFAFSPLGQQLATATQGSSATHWCDLWAYPALKHIKNIPCKDYCKVSYSQNGKWLAARDDKELQIVDLESGQTTTLNFKDQQIVASAFLGNRDIVAIRYQPVNFSDDASGMKLHAVPSLKELTWIPGYPYTFACSPGGLLFARGDFHTVLLSDIDAILASPEINTAIRYASKTFSWKNIWIENKGKFLKVGLNVPTKFSTDDTGVSDLAKAATLPWVIELKLSGKVRDAGLAELGKFKELQKLTLDGLTEVTDQGLTHLKHLEKLEELKIAGLTNISDAGLAHLHKLKYLKTVNLFNTKVTETGVKALRDAIPNLSVSH